MIPLTVPSAELNTLAAPLPIFTSPVIVPEFKIDSISDPPENASWLGVKSS